MWVDLDPVRGSEQAGTRPALVVSETVLNQASHHTIICPITSNHADWPTKVPLPDGLPVRGAVLVDQIRSLDRHHRGFRLVCKAPPTIVAEVRRRLAALLGLNPP